MATLVGLDAHEARALNAEHIYRFGRETTAAGHITGVRVQRWDLNLDAQSSVCDKRAAPPLITQTAFVYITPGAGGDFIEFGTLHHTPTCKNWYWAYRAGGVFHYFPLQSIGNGEHVFKIVRDGTGRGWQFLVDGMEIAHPTEFFINNVGVQVAVGLEAYNSDASVVGNGYYNLRYNQGGIDYPWGGRDGIYSTPDTRMCSRWSSDTHFRSAINQTC